MDIITFVSLLVFLFLLWLFYTRFLGAEFYPTTEKKILRMIEFARLGKNDTAYDLGCGDARIVAAAAKKSKESIGIEIDPLRFMISWLKIKFLGIRNARIIFGDIFKKNLRNADVIFLFLRQKTNDRLQEKFMRELKPGARIISHYWIFKGWKPAKQDRKLRVYLYLLKK